MLQTFLIKNFAIIDDLMIDFGEELNILTGETGAGKSIIIDALGLILGDRANTKIVRKNAPGCELTASFNIENLKPLKKLLAEIGVPQEDTLIIKREITADGKTKCFINGSIASVGMLQTISSALVDIHGQHEHQSLTKPDSQRDMLDRYGNLEKLKSEISDNFEKFTSIKNQLYELKNSEKDRIQKLDLYKYQLKEIEEAKLFEMDENGLENEINRLNNAEKLFNYANDIYSILYESDGSAVEKLGIAKKHIENLAAIDRQEFENIAIINRAVEDVKSLADTFRQYKDSVEFNPKRLEEIIVKIELIKKLKRKYAPTIKEILDYADNIKKQINLFEKADENIAKLEKDVTSAEAKLKKLSIELSEKRTTVAKKLSKEIEAELMELGMAKSKFFISVEKETDETGNYHFKSSGIDRIEYKISANVGEDLKPLKTVASGGEMSRVMLAIKTVLAKADDTPTLIFDEIDAGLSGPMGQVVGKKLSVLSKNHQILCITHLPQLAAFSSEHFHISKTVAGGKTKTLVSKLNAGEKVTELSRMLGGGIESETSIKHAKELIKQTN
ncbi:MAG: DNA repair protein RecN [Elusimicrobia bacterium HGW-Elusimicrobia-4]|nr:MAG: DNA repair protein RecN [Elusimicrobia bacterium HGW-Elusimicrobia-4]